MSMVSIVLFNVAFVYTLARYALYKTCLATRRDGRRRLTDLVSGERKQIVIPGPPGGQVTQLADRLFL